MTLAERIGLEAVRDYWSFELLVLILEKAEEQGFDLKREVD